MLSGRCYPRPFALVLVLGALAVTTNGCQSGGESGSGAGAAAAVPAEYRRDIERVCDVVARSGSDQDPENSPILIMAEWLAANLETEAGHDFLVAFQQTPDGDKGAKLINEARRVGLAGCELATMWPASPAG